MTPAKILVVTASVREGRRADQIVQWFRTFADKRTDLTFDYADLKEIVLPFYAHTEMPRAIEHEYADPVAQQWVKMVEAADGFIFVMPEYNHSYAPSLKNALDYIKAGWIKKPVAFVAYGGVSGGIRAIEQMKPVVLDLQLYPVHNEVIIHGASRAFNEQGELLNPRGAEMAQAMLDDLAWWAPTLSLARQKKF